MKEILYFMKPIARKENIVVQATKLEILVYDLTINKAFLLNKTSAFVWQSCDGTRDVSEISQALAKRSKQPINDEIVWLAIEQLKKENLMDNKEELKSGFEGLNRREVIRKIGFTTMIALPLISYVVAPTAANATSGVACLALNQTGCIRNNYQQSNCCNGLRCDDFTATTGFCRACLTTGTPFGGFNITQVSQCNPIVTRNLCCNFTGTPTVSNGTCLCP